MLTLCDYMLAVAAYAYEVEDDPCMSDNSYDILAKEAGLRNTTIPGFGDMTGQWVHNLDLDLLGTIWEYAVNLHDADDIHPPAIQAALDHYEVPYTCCKGTWQCWD